MNSGQTPVTLVTDATLDSRQGASVTRVTSVTPPYKERSPAYGIANASRVRPATMEAIGLVSHRDTLVFVGAQRSVATMTCTAFWANTICLARANGFITPSGLRCRNSSAYSSKNT